MTWEIKAGVMGKTSVMAAEYILSHFPRVKEDMTVEEYMKEGDRKREELFRKVEPMRGAAALVKGLYDAGVPIALATGSTYENFQYKTTHLPHIFSLFPPSCILTGDSPEVKPGRGKPKPDVFLAAAHSLGKDVGTAEECTDAQRIERSKGIVFEDARPGVTAGVAAGMNVIWVPDPELLALDPEANFGAKQVLSHLEEFNPEEWGLPRLEGFNHCLPTSETISDSVDPKNL
ncbi:hypothetical protein L486_07107 [Kwoniella mangroviensis CBS 10435]|uniref:HAD hydrolase, family IA n=1 Tax=Kwoniella mangroviensis CBS 10435 TaxID=1331196 RepID=A0A1B9IJA6_9TREE|nr:hypothetical protein L486_07107 [Kwoniella mangroviensis CBS 10435]